MTTPPRDFELPFVKKEQVARDAWQFYFDRTASSDFDFFSGQYIRMTLDVSQSDERGSSRFFSVSSSPLNKKYLTITTHVMESAFKKSLLTLLPNTAVKFFGPVGRFFLNEEEKRQHIFLAGGIGITPFHSIITYAAEKSLSVPITLVVSFSKVEDCVFYDELTKIAKDHTNIKIVYTITRSDELQKSWTGEKGRINADFIKKYVPDFINSIFYISGSSAMVDAMLALVKEMGVPDEQVKKEKFVGY